jgi:hypothetical protein
MTSSFIEFNNILREAKSPIMRKIIINSIYPLIPNEEFQFYNPEVNERIQSANPIEMK